MSAPDRVLQAVKFKAMSFDGVDDYVDCGNPPSLQITTSFSVEAWFNPKVWNDGINASAKPIVNKFFFNSGDMQGWYLGRSGTAVDGIAFKIYYGDGSSDGIFNGGNIELLKGTWINVTGVYKSGEYIKLYINGKLESIDNTVKGSFINAITTLKIGRRSDYVKYFYGYIGEVRIYNRALTDDEVKYNYGHPHNPILNGLVLWLSHDTIDEGKSKWYDKSGNGNDGTIYGATAIEMNKLAGRVLSAT